MASGVRTLSSLHNGQHNRTAPNDGLGHAPNQMSLHFLDLPVDILALILAPLLIQDGPIPLCPCGSTGSNDKDSKGDSGISINPVPILLIHPAIYAIATPLFYEGNVFVLDLRLKHGLHARSYLDEQAEEDALDRREGFNYDDVIIRRRREALALEGSLRRIRSLEIKILKLRGWIDARIVPLVRDMIVRGNLAELTVKIYSSGGHTAGGTRAQAAREGSIFTRPPLAGVLSLLSDPYLRTARLWVSATAGGAWEPFRTATASADLVQIDWASIVKQLDPEGRQVAVLRDGGKANVAR
ncbi:hypothetical protein H634G_05225 [Metarhizium anisopliae BRIP 53293]|uniref:Uncharacterized protein n=1 Tax=Metarhizium anisopliae BRIP 53293 TaxID=1291518 RepID=A0A0D9P0P7_METAN|nr:hypothetical protein H634G_05225 [Metarhizium anisopliae BRIP 53293]KJK90642.1 hypothetical protein H633G_05550 [Metarhizium anisopliae BRIP 53284]